MIYRVVLLLTLFLAGCSWFCPENKPIVVTKPVYIKPPKYPIPLRPEIRKLDEDLEIYDKENFRKLAYNISDTETYLKNLLEVIKYYETYTPLEKLDAEDTDQDNVEENHTEDNDSSSN